MGRNGDVEEILGKRDGTHGQYKETAKTAQELKAIFRSKDDWQYLLPIERESVDLICTKLARLIHGGGDKTDTVRDIEGYARLMIREEADANSG